jgi:hypothetical protein
MKKILTSLALCLFFTGAAVADVAPSFQFPWDKTYQVQKSVQITNASQFPDFSLLQIEEKNPLDPGDSPFSQTPPDPAKKTVSAIEIKDNENLKITYTPQQYRGGYSQAYSDNYRVIALRKTTLDKNGGLNGVDWAKLPEGKDLKISTGIGYIKGVPLTERVFKYQLKALDQNNLTLSLKEIVLKYENGSDKIITF